MNEYLSKLKKFELEILDETVQICENNNIKYYLFFDILLGAVRHKGYIPWDDDIDIVMPRNDYEKFLSIASKKLPEKFLLDCDATNKPVLFNFCKD